MPKHFWKPHAARTAEPLRPASRAQIDNGAHDAGGACLGLAALWQHLGKPMAASDAADVWSLGESADDHNAALTSLEAPDFELPDFSGRLHRLSDFRRKRVLLITWASW